jgi:hypothetical protein
MQTPERWPLSSETSWREYRDYLDRAQLPNVPALKRETDAELARIARVQEGRWEGPKKPALVPRDRAANGVRS